MQKPFSGSFEEAVAYELRFRQTNAALAERLGLPPERKSCENWVDSYNALRCIAGGWKNFVQTEAPTLEPSVPVQKKTSVLGRVVEVARATKAGIGVWLEMFGPDGKPVEQSLAESRAAICAKCQANDKVGNLRDYLIISAVQKITKVYEMMRDLQLTTAKDAELGVCSICICPLKAKVHVKVKTITDHMPTEVKAKLPGHCWVLRES